jgi:integrase
MNRRGFGSVYRPKYRDRKTGEWKESPNWWIAYSFRGEKYREPANSTKHIDAVNLLRRRMEEMGRGRLVGPAAERVSFDDLKQMLEWDYRANGRKSLARAEVALKPLERFFGLYRALDITTDKIMQYVTTRQEAPVKPATIHYELSILKRMFNLVIQAEKLDRKPYIPMIQVSNVRAGFFSESQFLSVLSRLPEEVKPLVELLWLTGWRKTEGMTLQWPQVDWANRSIRLDPGTTKEKDGRTVPFWNYPQLEGLLERQRAYTDSVQCAKAQIIPWVFHRNGEPIKSFRGAWERACIEAGVPGAWVHDFRRSTVRRLEKSNVPRSHAMKITGHKTESIYRRYAIVVESDIAEATGKLSAYHEDQTPSVKARAKWHR